MLIGAAQWNGLNARTELMPSQCTRPIKEDGHPISRENIQKTWINMDESPPIEGRGLVVTLSRKGPSHLSSRETLLFVIS